VQAIIRRFIATKRKEEKALQYIRKFGNIRKTSVTGVDMSGAPMLS